MLHRVPSESLGLLKSKLDYDTADPALTCYVNMLTQCHVQPPLPSLLFATQGFAALPLP